MREVVSILSIAERTPSSGLISLDVSPASLLPTPHSPAGKEKEGNDGENENENDSSLIMREPLGSRLIDLTRYGDLESVQNIDIQCYQLTISVGVIRLIFY